MLARDQLLPEPGCQQIASKLPEPPRDSNPGRFKLASRWVIPGLAALGSGTLAALAVWLLYRRRHPARPSRQGRSHLAH
jgi:hypothetical protein